MRIIQKVVFFSLLFSFVFFLIRLSPLLNQKILTTNELGTISLYSVIGVIFGVTSAFIIQSQWSNWNELLNAIREEINGLRQLLLFSSHVSAHDHLNEVTLSIKDYLEKVIKYWCYRETGKQGEEIEQALASVQEEMYDMFERKQNLAAIAYNIFSNILILRDHRIHYSSPNIPFALQLLLRVSTILLISLSLLIAIPDMWLDFIFTLSVSVLAVLVYVVIDDLNNPLRPGNWHVTEQAYKDLLKEIDKKL